MDVEVGDAVIHKGRRGIVLKISGDLLLIKFERAQAWVERKYVVRLHSVDEDIKLD